MTRPAGRPRAALLAAGVIGTLMVGCGAPARDQTLVVHSPLPAAVLAHAEEVFEADFPTVDVQVVGADSDETLAALRAGEAVDVWWWGDAIRMEQAALEDLLRPYQPEWVQQPGVGRPDPEGRWQASQVSPFVIAFNRERTTLAEAPSDWVDLFQTRWWNDLLILDPTIDDDMSYFVGSMLVEALRDDDDLGRGFDWLTRLDRSTKSYVRDAQEIVRRLASGESSLAILPRHVVEEARHDGSSWIHYRLPPSGTPILVRGVAVSASTGLPDFAEAFVQLTGTVEMGTFTRLHTRWMPSHGDIDEASLPDDFEIDMPWKPYPLAIDSIARELPGWIERWDGEVRGMGRR